MAKLQPHYNLPTRLRTRSHVLFRRLQIELLQDVLGIMDDQKLTKILTYDNYSKDGVEFKKSLSYLNSTKEEFNTKIDILINNLDDESIIKYGEEQIKDPYYVGLYKELMFNDEFKNEFDSTRELLNRTKTRMNSIFDNSIAVLTFLRDNKDSWKLEDGEIKFATQEDYNKYMAIIEKIKPKEKDA